MKWPILKKRETHTLMRKKIGKTDYNPVIHKRRDLLRNYVIVKENVKKIFYLLFDKNDV